MALLCLSLWLLRTAPTFCLRPWLLASIMPKKLQIYSFISVISLPLPLPRFLSLPFSFPPPLAVFGLTSLYPFRSSMPFQFLQGPMVQVRFIHLSCNQEGSLNLEPFPGSCEVGRLFQAGYLRTLSASVPPLCFLLINRTAIPKGMHPLPFSRAEFIFHCMFLFKQKAF